MSSADEFIDECITSCKFDHPNVLKTIGISISSEQHAPLMVMPFMHNGSVLSYIKKIRKKTKMLNGFPEV